MGYFFRKQFKKQYSKLPPKIQTQFDDRFKIFLNDETHPLLNVHQLRGGREGQYTFNVNADYRVVFSRDREVVIFHEIGTHSELYQ